MTAARDVVARLLDRVRGPGRQRHARTVVKTAGYRVLMIAITVAVAFAVTDDVSSAVNIGLVANLVKTGTYYAYERLWDRIDWGHATVESDAERARSSDLADD